MCERDDWMLPGEAARTLKVDRSTAARWAREGRIPGATRTLTGHWRYPRAAVLKLAASLAVPADLPPAGPAGAAP